MRKSLVLSVLSVLCLSAVVWGESHRVKLIDLSWSNPTVPFLKEHLTDMEKNSPLDGVVIRVWGKKGHQNGKTYTPGQGAWGTIAWKEEDFSETVAELKKLPFKQFTDNFFYLTVSPGDADWFSDEDFACVANNFRIAARVSRESGLKGFLFDVEEYGKKFWRYRYLKTSHSMKEALTVARQRGKQVGEAVFQEFPHIRIIMPFMLSYQSSMDLQLAFMDGFLSVMTPEARIYEGHESFSYRARRPQDYLTIQNHFRTDLRRRISEDNQKRLVRQCSVAPAFYMDPIMAPKGSPKIWHQFLMPDIEEGDGPRSFLRRNLSMALETTDDYIWLYSERGAWWTGGRWPHWEEKLPGLVSMIRTLKTPSEGVIPPEKNLVVNPYFKEADQAWKLWQLEDDLKKPVPGGGKVGEGRCRMWKINQGCFTQNIAVKPGSCYLVVMRGGNTSDGTFYGSVAFMDKNRKWLPSSQNITLRFPLDGGISCQTRCVFIPEDAYFVSFQLSAAGQREQGEVFFTYAGMMEL